MTANFGETNYNDFVLTDIDTSTSMTYITNYAHLLQRVWEHEKHPTDYYYYYYA